jgi:hypothetical protein
VSYSKNKNDGGTTKKKQETNKDKKNKNKNENENKNENKKGYSERQTKDTTPFKKQEQGVKRRKGNGYSQLFSVRVAALPRLVSQTGTAQRFFAVD